MLNKKYYPFERNHYFYGKLLTVRDFEEEQKYMNDKRRLHAALTTGAGVAAGLAAVALDDRTLSIEAGMAVDYLGREIVIAESVTKQLHVIDGFNALQDFNNVYLCLSYREEKNEIVHSVTATADDASDPNSFNRVRETYRLYLTDHAPRPASLTPEFLLKERQVVYNADGLRILHIFPRAVRAGETATLTIRIEKRNLPRPVEVDYRCALQYLLAEDGQRSLSVRCRDEDICAHKTLELEFRLTADAVCEAEGSIAVLAESGNITAGDASRTLSATAGTVQISRRSAAEEAIRLHLARHFDDILFEAADEPIYLARMQLLRQEEHYAIDVFEPLPFRQYLLSNAMLAALLTAEKPAAAPTVRHADPPRDALAEAAAAACKTAERRASGELTIEIAETAKNKAFYSAETAHSLGPGNTQIVVAVEDLYDPAIFDTRKAIFGDPTVFSGSLYEPAVAPYSVGVLSYADRGTFRVGIRFQQHLKVAAVKVKWWAVQIEEPRAVDLEEAGKISLRIFPNTVSLSPREKTRFEAIITGADDKECHWNILEPNGGKIDCNGVYEAPSREGVYEILAEYARYPQIRASAFVIVKK